MANHVRKGYARTVTIYAIHRLFYKKSGVFNSTSQNSCLSTYGLSEDYSMRRDMVEMTKRISHYSSRGKPDLAGKIFDEMSHRDSVSWNVMIGCYVQNRRIDEARQLFDQMPERNTVSWNSMIMAYVHERKTHIALKLFVIMPNKDIISWTTMISGLSRDFHIDDSWTLFELMPMEPNSVSWSSVISGFQQNGFAAKALKLFNEMLETGTQPNSHSFASTLAASADLAALSKGLQLYCQVLKRGLDNNNHVENSAISMFMKSGNLDNARRIFDAMPERNVVTWNSMIMGYAQHGYGVEAIDVFYEMQKAGLKPDEISLLGVLQACSHRGFVEQGWVLFHGMQKDHGMSPKPAHYDCMVDMLARAGSLKEAAEVIRNMPFKPTAVFWRTLLNGCRIYGDLELGEYAADRVWELEPDNAASCMMVLEKMYKAVGRQVESTQMRRLMRGREGRKELGCSWIEVRGQIHLFSTRDETHRGANSIYMTTELLARDVADWIGISSYREPCFPL